ncbi:MAG: PAS domain-containing protein, partial [Rectinemataceae bacterium]|nr:PAS domain-containing protein [Rectinemataceae bacterium]
VHPEDLDRCVQTYLDAFHARLRFEMEYRIRNARGEYRWIVDIGRPMSGTNGEFSGYIGYCFDITEHREIQKKMEDQLAELRRWHEITMGREERILGLKAEVNEALARTGEPARYEVTNIARQS